MKKISILLFTALMMVACKSGNSSQELAFENYEVSESLLGPAGASTAIELEWELPVGDGDLQQKVTEGLRQIISQSIMNQSLGVPVEGPLKSVADAMKERFVKGVPEGEVDEGCIYHLLLKRQYQNSQCVVYSVSDGVFANGGPHITLRPIRLSDGKLMAFEDIVTMKLADVEKLARKYDKENVENWNGPEAEGYSIAPDSAGCTMMVLYGAHFYTPINVPVDDIVPFLTEEGKQLFELTTEGAAEADAEPESEDGPLPEIGVGDLGIFDLRGPVKKVSWSGSTYTFDRQGRWLTQDGQKLSSMFPGGLKRDAQGHLKEANADGFGSCYYEYNADGQATVISGDGFNRKLTYDDNMHVVKEEQTFAPDMGDEEGEEEHVTLNFTILETDEMGNWTKRKSKNGTETRKITYFD